LLNNLKTKYLGIDYGKKKTGISISDQNKIISFPLETIQTKNIIPYLKEIIVKEKIEKIIIGKPLKLNNEIHDIEIEIKGLIKSIKSFNSEIEINRIDERYTSKLSKIFLNQFESKQKKRRNKSIIDKISASLILESYLIRVNK
tara:strand:- start:11393 stop:11824 length:432 start_codon:yes stop_codon:yes gene_type:complete